MILTLAGILFGFDKALYSIIFQYASTQVLHVLYKKYQQPLTEREILVLPSTSPANAAWSLDRLYEKWSEILR